MLDTLTTGEAPSLDSPPFALSSNEPTTENVPSPPIGLVEKIQRKAAGVFESHGVFFKRGGGRPRKDGKPNKLDAPLNAPAAALPSVAAVPAPLPRQEGLDPLLVKRCCSAAWKALSSIFDKIVHRKALIVGYSPEQANQLVTDCRITTEEMESFSDLAEVCLRKYGVGTEYAPEIGLGSILLSVGVRYSMALKTLDASRKEKLRGENITELPK